MELGIPTIATSGVAWVSGSKWGAYEGMLAVAALKGAARDVHALRLRRPFLGVRMPTALRKYGRLRSISRLPNGRLMVTTSNGDGRDSVLRVEPVG